MRQEYASETLRKSATLYIALDDEETEAAVEDHRKTSGKGVSRAALRLAYVNPDAAMTPKQDSDRQTLWSKVLNFLTEGFAVDDVSLPPAEDVRKDDRWAEAKSESQDIASNGRRVTEMFSTPTPAVEPHWNWLASSREAAAAIGTHLRKERDIKRAVDALSELDDQTLRDIGIPHRSRIEYVVRYCHDC